jgi:hypothetical protein
MRASFRTFCHQRCNLSDAKGENAGRGPTSAADQKSAEISLPVATTVFPDVVYRSPESWAGHAYPKLIYLSEVGKGGHFAAWEQRNFF